jgi:hypothetical protein
LRWSNKVNRKGSHGFPRINTDLKKALAGPWQLAKAMKKKKISKVRMAVLLKTSRSQVDRILDPKRDITLSSLQRAAALVGQRVMIELV